MKRTPTCLKFILLKYIFPATVLCHFDDHISRMVNIRRCADCFFKIEQRKLMSDYGFEVPFSTAHHFLYISYIIRQIAAGTNDALLGIGHVKKVNSAGYIINCNGNEAALNFTKVQKICKNRFCSSGIQPAVDIRSLPRAAMGPFQSTI